MTFWRRSSKEAEIRKQIEDVQHLALVTGMMMLRRGAPTEGEYSQLEDALSRFRGVPEVEPIRQAVIKELKRRADEEGDVECAKILERVKAI